MQNFFWLYAQNINFFQDIGFGIVIKNENSCQLSVSDVGHQNNCVKAAKVDRVRGNCVGA